MANIVLKDKNGTPVNYSPVPAKLSVHGYDNNGEETDYQYVRLAYMYCYSIKVVSEGVFLVTNKFPLLNLSGFSYTGFSENEMREYGFQTNGSWGMNIIYTTKNLTVGNTYNAEDLA